jgi:hypothetical protein
MKIKIKKPIAKGNFKKYNEINAIGKKGDNNEY